MPRLTKNLRINGKRLTGLAPCGAMVWLVCAGIAQAGDTYFSFDITNDTSTDLKFDVNNKQNDHLRIVSSLDVDGNISPVVIKSGDSQTIYLQPKSNRKLCGSACGYCVPVKGRLKAYYKGEDGKYKMNNYYKVEIGFSQYCANGGVTSFTSDWDFEHHQGDGDNYYNHEQKDKKTGSYTGGSGFTFDAKKYKASITVIYTDP